MAQNKKKYYYNMVLIFLLWVLEVGYLLACIWFGLIWVTGSELTRIRFTPHPNLLVLLNGAWGFVVCTSRTKRFCHLACFCVWYQESYDRYAEIKKRSRSIPIPGRINTCSGMYIQDTSLSLPGLILAQVCINKIHPYPWQD